MPIFLQNLRCNVVGSAANGFFAVSFIFYFGAQSKITDLGVHEFVDEYVSQFEISMNNSLFMYIDHRFDNLCDVNSGLEFS